MPGIKSWSNPKRGHKRDKWSNRSADVVRTLHNRAGKETADSGFRFQKTRGNWEWRSQERKQQLVLQLHLHFSITKPTKRRLNFKEWLSYIKEWKAAWTAKKWKIKPGMLQVMLQHHPPRSISAQFQLLCKKHSTISIPSVVSNIFMLHGKKIL